MLELLNLNDLDIDAIKTAETTFLQRPTINKALSDCISDDRFIEIEDQIELSGSLLHLHIRIVPLHYPESEISSAFLIVENITSRKNSERELMISEERYRSLQNNVPVGVFRVF
jgi:PAS domain-containing protein